MIYIYKYISPIGELSILSNKTHITSIRINDQESNQYIYNPSLPIFKKTIKWLDIYFSGHNPSFKIPILPEGTIFRKKVWQILNNIPYGKLITYGDIAKQLALKMKINKMSAQAIGGAVGHNPIPIIIPCHRVIGTKNNLTGFSCGMDKKIKLLSLEGHNMNDFIIPN